MSTVTNPAGSRFAVYFAPPEDAPLWAFGNSWLGRDAATGTALRRPAVEGFDAGRLDAITRTAAGYGFHATLKPPFSLAPDRASAELDSAIRTFCHTRTGFLAPPLELAFLDGFVALRPSASCDALDRLAADCVRAFGGFRAPPSAEDLSRRRRDGLTPVQERLLTEWGYPYVLEEWRFHMTLSCRLSDDERRTLMDALAPLVAPFCAAPFAVESICLFGQEDRSAPFRLLARYPFAGLET